MSAVARVLVDTGLPHLDRIFDYSIPQKFEAVAQPGVRVKVRFAGTMREGWLIDRVDSSEHRLSPLASVVSAESVLAPEIASLAQAVAERFAGISTDVLRTAIPPRQARVEKESLGRASLSSRPVQAQEVVGPPDGYRGLTDFLQHLPEAPRASWQLLPGRTHMADVAATISVAAGHGGVLVVVPDGRDVRRLYGQLADVDLSRVVLLTADLPAAERYRNFLRVRRGLADIVIGTRSAVFAPIQQLRLIIVVDDGDESHVEPHAPGWNTRAVASLRAYHEHVSLVIAGHSVSVEAQALVDQGWLGRIDPDPDVLRVLQPRVAAQGDSTGARIPTSTWKVIRQGLSQGLVLVSAPFGGYQPTLACQKCREPAECRCGGRLAAEAGGMRRCRLCGNGASDWRCPHCGSDAIRATTVGATRITEELGRAFPGVRVLTSTGEHAIDEIDDAPGIVVSTTGVEPRVHGGFVAAVILDGDAQLSRSDLRVEEEVRRRWFNALALVAAGAPVGIVATSTHPAVQAAIAWAPRRAAQREVHERERSHLSPAWQVATIEGEELSGWRQEMENHGIEVLGPVMGRHGQRLVARLPRTGGVLLADVLRDITSGRSSRKDSGARVRIDPFSLD